MARHLAFALLVCASASQAQMTERERLFGKGVAPIFRESDVDRRFARSGVYRALSQGTADANCQQLIGGLLEVLASTAPLLHKRDENFYLEPGITQALQTQLSTPNFPGTAFLAAMVRRVAIDGKMPSTWLDTANQLAQARTLDDRRLPMDTARLKLLEQGLHPIDSFWFTLPALLVLYEQEVARATSVSRTAEIEFRDAYVDRDVAWGGLTLVDISHQKLPPPKKGKGVRASPVDEPAAFVAHLTWTTPNPNRNRLQIFGKKESDRVTTVTARLAEPQYLALSQLPRGRRVLVRGRLWDMTPGLSQVEVRNALIFDDPDTAQALLADPQAVAQCPFAVNDLAGLAPTQPGGFGQH